MKPDILSLDQRTVHLECTRWTKTPRPSLHLDSIEGREALGEDFEYHMVLQQKAEERLIHHAKDYLGEEMSVRIGLDDGTDRWIHGVIKSWQCIAREALDTEYHALVVPYQWLMTQRINHRVFQHKTVPEIIRTVLSEYPGWYAFQLGHDYPAHEYQVQYAESDWAFIGRLMQEWGISFYWTHEQERHTMVLCDRAGAKFWTDGSSPRAIRYDPSEQRTDQEECIQSVHLQEAVVTSHHASQDYDFQDPLSDMLTHSQQQPAYQKAPYEVYSHPGDYSQALKGQGSYLSEVRLKQLQAEHQFFYGQAINRRLRVGYHFSLVDHPHLSHNHGHIVRALRLHLRSTRQRSHEQAYEYRVSFVAHRNDDFYVQPQTYSKPYVAGVQSARVVGPASEEIHTDVYARVRIQFPWDREGQNDEHATCWVRVSQQWAGQDYGMIALPRIGQEVLVSFEHGDPDRPIITGRVYNDQNMPPWTLPANKTQSGLLSRSTPDGGYDTANALRFEDRKGEEQIWWHAERDQDVEVEHDETHWIGQDRQKRVEHDEANRVDRNRTERVSGHEQILIQGNRHKNVQVNERVLIEQDYSEHVGLNHIETVHLYEHETVAISDTQVVGLHKIQAIGGVYSTQVGINHMHTTGLDRHDRVGNTWHKQVSGDYVIDAGQNIVIDAGQRIVLKSGSAALVLSPHSIEAQGSTMMMDATNKIELKSLSVALNPGAGGDMLETPTSKWIAFKAPGQEDFSGVACKVYFDDGRAQEGTFDEENQVRIQGVGNAQACKKIEILNEEEHDDQPAIISTLLSQI